MLRYIVRRLLWLVFVLVVIVAITYSIFFLLPGGGTDTIAQRFAGKAPHARDRRSRSSSRWAWTSRSAMQFVYLHQAPVLRRPVRLAGPREVVRPAAAAQAGADRADVDHAAARARRRGDVAVIGIPIGVLSALTPTIPLRPARDGVRADRDLDPGLRARSAGAVASSRIKLAHPARAPATIRCSEYGFGPWFSHFLLPWFVLALLYAAFYARLSRANLLDMMGEDYMRTARAKGLKRATGDRAARAARPASRRS